MYKIQAKGNKVAEVYIYEDVGAGWFGGVSAKQFADDLKALGAVQSIDVRINSYGGDVFDGLAIYRQLVDHGAKVTTYIDGVAASIASIIAMAGSEIVISESGFLMIHNAWTMTYGDSPALREVADRLDAVTEQLANVYVKRTGKTKDQVQAWMNEETWFNSGDAVANGFASRVSENLQIAAKADPTKLKFRSAPSALQQRPDFDAAKKNVVALTERLAMRTRLATQKSSAAA